MKSFQEIYNKLRQFSEDYYSLDKQNHQISDDEYDALLQEFEELYKSIDNPTPQQTQMYESVINGDFAGIDNPNQDRTLMLSIRKYKLGDNISDFKKKIDKVIFAVKKPYANYNRQRFGEIYYMPKFDGIAIGFERTSDGNSYKIITRGGQDITPLLKNHKQFKEITDKYLKTHKYLRGELVIDKTIFNSRYFGEYKNPRNCIVGVLKNGDVDDLSMIVCTDGLNPMLDNQFIRQIQNIRDFKMLWDYYFNEIKNTKFPYQTDGVVLYRIADSVLIEQNQYPNNIFAIKFPSESKPTYVTDIEWTLGKSGKYTPVLIVEPVEIDGSVITKVSAYSFDNLKTIRAGVDSRIIITKSNDIIPKIVSVMKDSTEYRLPKDYIIDGKHIFQQQKNDEIENNKFILGLKALNIVNIGDTIASQLGNNVFNNDIIEVFNPELKPKIIKDLGESQIARFKAFSEIYNIKTLYLDKLIFMLQFDGCGIELSKRCALLITKQNLDTTGMNKDVVKRVCNGTGFLRIQAAIAKLHKYGVKVLKPIDTENDSIITYEMTGTPPNNMSKQDIIKYLMRTFDNKLIHTTLTKQTKLLLTNDVNSNSSKINKARKYGIKIVTYADVLQWKQLPKL